MKDIPLFSPGADLDMLQAWFARHSPDNVPMTTLLLKLERIVRFPFGNGLEIVYAIARVDEALEVSIEVATGGAKRCRAILGLCCRAGRFFKRYGPSYEERIFFGSPEDAGQYVIFVLGQKSAAERPPSSSNRGLRSGRLGSRTSVKRIGS